LLRVAFAWAQRDEGTVLLEQRGLEGLWAGQWQLPGEEGPRARARLQARLGCRLATRGVVVNHSLTHRDVLATIYEVRDLVAVDLPRSRWYGDPDAAALSALARKAIAAFRHTGER